MFEDSYLDSFMEDHISGGAGAYYDECYYDEDQDRDVPVYDEYDEDDEYYDNEDRHIENADFDFDKGDWFDF